MAIEIEPAKQRAPIFGGLSIIAPVFSGLFVLLSAFVFADNFNLMMLCLMLIPAPPVLGIVFAIVGVLRREGFWALPWIGLIVNLALLIWGVSQLKNVQLHM